MTHKKNLWLGIVAAFALAMTGCGDDDNSNGGSGGTAGMGGGAGEGGMGGTPAGMAMVRVAHLGTNLPTAENTLVDVTVNGEVAIEDLAFEMSTGFIPLAEGEYTFGVNIADTDTEVFSATTTLPADSITTVVAIASVNIEEEPEDVTPLNALIFNGDLTDLDSGSGRVLVGHGFDAEPFAVVDVILPATCEDDGALVPDLAFPTVETVGDLPEANYDIALAAPDSCEAAVGPLTAPVTPDVATLLIAAADAEGNPQVYALIGDFASGEQMEPIPTLSAAE
jgi:hypothetical protein